MVWQSHALALLGSNSLLFCSEIAVETFFGTVFPKTQFFSYLYKQAALELHACLVFSLVQSSAGLLVDLHSVWYFFPSAGFY